MIRIIYEFIVANPDDAFSIANYNIEHFSFPYFRCFNLDISCLAQLYFLCEQKPYNDQFLSQFSLLEQNKEKKQSVIMLPDRFWKSLCNLDHQRIHIILQHWKESENSRFSRWHKNFRNNVLTNLIDLSKQCAENNLSLLLKIRMQY